MSVNSPLVPVVVPRREALRAPARVAPSVATAPRLAGAAPAAAPTRGVALGVERGPGAHREPGVTFWRTSMRELVYFLTLGYVQPWRRVRATARSAT